MIFCSYLYLNKKYTASFSEAVYHIVWQVISTILHSFSLCFCTIFMRIFLHIKIMYKTFVLWRFCTLFNKISIFLILSVCFARSINCNNKAFNIVSRYGISTVFGNLDFGVPHLICLCIVYQITMALICIGIRVFE